MSLVNVTVDPEIEVIVVKSFIENQRMLALQSFLLMALYAFLLSTYLAVLYYLWWKDGLRSALNKVHMVAVTVMFALTTVYIASDLLVLRETFDVLLNPNPRAYDGTEKMANELAFATFSTTVVIGDAIILWRAAMICAWPGWLRILCAVVVVGQEVSWIIGEMRDYDTLVAEVISLAISLVATIAISENAWRHRIMIRAKIAMVSRRGALDSIFTILTDTGVVYTALWALYIPTHLPSDGPNGAFNVAMTDIMTIAAPIYPMMIVIVVARHKSQLGEQLTSIEPITVVDAERLELLPEEDTTHRGHNEFNPYTMVQKTDSGAEDRRNA